ncbi:MAG: hypothetical protein EHM20_14400, partial [Alphaproteobacteria bacterium]
MCIAILTKSYCSEPEAIFSHERGFYYSSFELTIDAGSEICNILYTLDGSDPRYAIEAVSASSPLTISINPYNSDGRAISPAVIVRACAICGSDTGNVETHSYIYPAEVKYQKDISPDLAPYWPDERYISNYFPPTLLGWMQTDYQIIDLATDPEVIHRDEYYADFEPALLDIPTISLV